MRTKLSNAILQNPELFPNEFVDWLDDNERVWNAFELEALKLHQRGVKHYSSRTIVHVLRHHSAISEAASKWKINDHWSPYLARLFDLAHPDKAGLFEYRKTNREERKAA